MILNSDEKSSDLLYWTAEIVSAYVSNNSLPSQQLSELINIVHSTLSRVVNNSSTTQSLKPAVSIKKSITSDYLICLEDGKKLKMLKRHLRSVYNMTPEQYRTKWGLPSDYPMVAPHYATQRSQVAKEIGLGKKAARKSR